jgi:hypothetical protein
MLETYEIGIATGDSNVDGIVTIVGTVTHDVAGTVTTTVVGTEAITADETQSGTADHGTTMTDGDDETKATDDTGIYETIEAGTTTGDSNVDGIVTIVGTVTHDVAGMVSTLEDGIDTIMVDYTQSGTAVHGTTITDGDDETKATDETGISVNNVAGTTTGDSNVDGTVTDLGTETQVTGITVW